MIFELKVHKAVVTDLLPYYLGQNMFIFALSGVWTNSHCTRNNKPKHSDKKNRKKGPTPAHNPKGVYIWGSEFSVIEQLLMNMCTLMLAGWDEWGQQHWGESKMRGKHFKISCTNQLDTNTAPSSECPSKYIILVWFWLFANGWCNKLQFNADLTQKIPTTWFTCIMMIQE